MTTGKIILTRIQNVPVSFLMEQDQVVEIDADGDKESRLNHVYIGKVKNIASNINAAFVELEPSVMGFLPLEDCKQVVVLNRVNTGNRLVAGDEIIVQVIKDAVKTKDAVLSLNISLPGNYCIVSSENKKIGFSKNISKLQKKFLQKKIEGMDTLGFGVIIRSNAEQLSEETIPTMLDEIHSLSLQLEALFEQSKSRKVYTKLYEEEPFYIREIRNSRIYDSFELVTDQQDFYDKISQSNSFSLLKNEMALRFYQDKKLSLCSLYGLNTKLQDALSKKVYLKSGGYLIIEPTEALTVIDVNTGKTLSHKKREETIFEINLEAAIESARQLRLRNISGIILTDFINMESKEHTQRLLQEFQAILIKDKIKTTLVDMTVLGLVELTRKKTTAPLVYKVSFLEQKEDS